MRQLKINGLQDFCDTRLVDADASDQDLVLRVSVPDNPCQGKLTACEQKGCHHNNIVVSAVIVQASPTLPTVSELVTTATTGGSVFFKLVYFLAKRTQDFGLFCCYMM